MKTLIERLKALRKAIAEGIEAHKSEAGVIDWAKVATIAAFTVPETDGAKDFAKAEDAPVDFAAMASDTDRVKAATDLYDLYDATKAAVEEMQEAEKADADAAAGLRDRSLSALVPVDAPAIITRRAQPQEFDLDKSLERALSREREVPLPIEWLIRRKSSFKTFGGEMIERSKADLDFPSQFAIAEDAPGTHFRPTILDYLRTILTPQSAYPMRTANSASTANAGLRDGTTGLPEAALHADIDANVLQIVGSVSPLDWHEKYTPGAMQWAMDELAMAARTNADQRIVRGTGDMNGFGDLTYATTAKIAVATAKPVLDGLADAAALSHENSGMAPDSLIIAPTTLARAQTEANTNSNYLAKGSPERNTDMLWDMGVVKSNQVAKTGSGATGTRKAYVFHSSSVAVAIHSSGFVMDYGLNGTDFRHVKETLRAYAAVQLIRRNTSSWVEVTITGVRA